MFNDQGTLGVGATSRFVKNGIYFEGFNFACTHPPHGTTIRNDGAFFSVDIWTYINVLNMQA